MKKIVIIFLISTVGYSQKKISTTIGKVTSEELYMKSYKNDSTASAVVLYEHANTYLSEEHDLNFVTDYYYRIKIFNKKSFDKSNVRKKPFQVKNS